MLTRIQRVLWQCSSGLFVHLGTLWMSLQFSSFVIMMRICQRRLVLREIPSLLLALKILDADCPRWIVFLPHTEHCSTSQPLLSLPVTLSLLCPAESFKPSVTFVWGSFAVSVARISGWTTLWCFGFLLNSFFFFFFFFYPNPFNTFHSSTQSFQGAVRNKGLQMTSCFRKHNLILYEND